MKILWKPVDDAPKITNEQHFSHEHLVLPPHIYRTLKQTLEASKLIQPQSGRKFQDWNVGLLERFSWEDISGSDATVLPAPKLTMPITGINEPENKEEEEKEENARERIRKIYGSEALLE